MAEIKNEDWMQKRWRPAMGWMYMIVCMMDMVIFPVLWSILQAVNHGQVTNQWQPLTLQGAGLFHLAMGAVLGIAAFGRTQEKVAGSASNVTTPSIPPSVPSAPIPVSAAPVVPASSSFSAPTASPFGAPVATGFGGKAAPLPAFEPEL
jgi:hypothetical protein